ncbi:MAG: hypothetical protein BWX73_02718 [Lentisphaerae bacterium ADurb.Bin082]|nr:MAG: hypothetical protein BWX73_02718 [Lentisphaerae bacterium ADurb.Bin082]
MSPQKSTLTVINQFFKYIPGYLITKLARKHQVDKKSRSFSPTSHVVSLMYAQLAHSISLNDVCDSLRNHSGSLVTLRGATRLAGTDPSGLLPLSPPGLRRAWRLGLPWASMCRPPGFCRFAAVNVMDADCRM